MSEPIRKKSSVLRVELELRSRFLKLYGIRDPYDFGKLAQILPERHIYFAEFKEKKLVARLRKMGFSPKKVWEIVQDVRLLKGDVWATLNYLRQELAMKNTRRLLDPLDANDLVLDALQKWAAMWPPAPRKLGRK